MNAAEKSLNQAATLRCLQERALLCNLRRSVSNAHAGGNKHQQLVCARLPRAHAGQIVAEGFDIRVQREATIQAKTC